MTLTLDPRYPLVWRTPTCLQIGVDNPPVTLRSVTLGHERMLAALTVGLTPEGLALVGTESGLTLHEVEEFRENIHPALDFRQASPCARVALAGVGPTVDRLGWRLAEAEIETHATGQRPHEAVLPISNTTSDSGSADFAVIVGHFVLDPEFRSVWLRRDVPHLPIVYSDTSVTIGPIIEPGHGPCLFCLELHHRDADSAWPALAVQLLGSRSTTETPFLASEVATLATRMILNRLRSSSPSTETGAALSLTLNATTGAQTRNEHSRHPDCACAGIADASALDLRENESASLYQTAGPSTQPTRAAAVSVPA